MIPDMVIHRDGDYLVAYELDAEFNIASAGQSFQVGQESFYSALMDDRIVLAQRIEGGSHSLRSYQICGPDEGEAVVAEIDPPELMNIVRHLCKDYLTTSHSIN